MLRYRAASFFGRQYVADLLLGIQTEDEIVEIQPMKVVTEEVQEQKKERSWEDIEKPTPPNTPHEAAIAKPIKEAEAGFGFRISN